LHLAWHNSARSPNFARDSGDGCGSYVCHLENGGASSVSQTEELLIDLFEKIEAVHESNANLTILVEALSGAVLEKFPDLPYDQHLKNVKASPSVRKLLEQQKAARESIEAARKVLLGKEKSS
jgi:hypothetical protein